MKKILLFLPVVAMALMLASCGAQQGGSKQDSTEVFKASDVKNPVKEVVYADSIEGEMGIVARIENGQVYVVVDQDKMMKKFGIVPRLTDATNQVQNLDTTIISISINDIGQDYNPVLCMLRADGKVQILSIFSAISEQGRFFASYPLPELENIVAFEQKGFEEYVGIVAKTKDGDEIEVPYNPVLSRSYVCTEGNKVCSILMTPDWKFVCNYYELKGTDKVKEEQYVGEYTVSFVGGEIDQQQIIYKMHTKADVKAEDRTPKPYTDEGVLECRFDDFGKNVFVKVIKGKTLQMTGEKELVFKRQDD